MIAVDNVTTGTRFRSAVSLEDYDQAPAEATDADRPFTIHWWSPSVDGSDPIAGARWGLAWSLQLVFGDTIGELLSTLTLDNVERWNGSSWELVA